MQYFQRVSSINTDSNDYNGFVGLEFIFDSAISTVNVSVPVIGDNVFELIEQFGATLTFPGAPPPRVTLVPDSAQVTILDDDGQYSACLPGD